MSYILDALKKADAQRERDPARGIHAQPAPLPTLQQPGLGQRPWLWAAAAAIAALAAAGWFLSQERADVQRPPVATSDAEPPRSAAVPQPAPAPLATSPAAPEPVADVVLPPPAPAAPPVVAAAPGRGDVAPGETATRAAPATRSPASGSPAGAPATAAPPPVPPAAVPAAPVPAPAVAGTAVPPPAAAPAATTATSEPPIANGLPADAPKLAISGGVYSANRAQRMLIVNGQVVNEGADLGGGIVLEEIRPKAAVLRFRGGRYNVGF